MKKRILTLPPGNRLLLLTAVLVSLLGYFGSSALLKKFNENVLFSGNVSGPLSRPLSGGFECRVTLSAAVSGPRALLLCGQDGAPVLRLGAEVVETGGRRTARIFMYSPHGRMDCGSYPLGVDNEKGKFQVSFDYDRSLLRVRVREVCAIFRCLDREVGSQHVLLPAAARVNIRPGSGVSARLFLPGAWRRWSRALELLRELCAVFLGMLLCGGAAACLCASDRTAETVRDIAAAGVLTVFFVSGLWMVLDISPVPPDISETVLHPGALYPEPGEQILYVSTLLAATFFLLVLQMFRCRLGTGGFWYGFSGSGVVLLLIFCRKPGGDFFQAVPLLPRWILCGVSAGLALCFLPPGARRLARKLRFVPACVFSLYAWGMVRSYLDRDFDFFDAYHYSVVLHPLWQAFYGISPWDGCPTYGAYAFFSLPYFRAAGLSPLSVSIFWLGLIFLVWGLLACTVRYLVPSRFWQYTAIAAIAGLPFVSGGSLYYAQYLPLRMVFPALILFLVCRTDGRILSPSVCIAGSALSAAAVLWNPDSGIVLLIAWGLLLVCLVWAERQPKNLLFLPLAAVSSCAVPVVVGCVHLLVYGGFPRWLNLFTMPLLFGRIGNFQLPMPYLGAWLIPGAVYFTALGWCVKRMCAGRLSGKDIGMLFTALLGCGLFGYYVGRSHDGNLLPVSYPALILLACGAARMYRPGATVPRLAAGTLLFLTVFSGLNRIGENPASLRERQNFSRYFKRLCDDVEPALSGERRFLFTGALEALIAVETAASPAFAHPALEELVLKRDCRNYCQHLRTSGRGALWVVNMDYLNRFSPELFRQLVMEELQLRLKRAIPPRALLMLVL